MSRSLRSRRLTLPLVFLAAFVAASTALAVGGGTDAWKTIGYDSSDSRNQPTEHRITPDNVDRLAPKWVATTHGDVSATPAVFNDAVYFGDFGGTLWKLDMR